MMMALGTTFRTMDTPSDPTLVPLDIQAYSVQLPTTNPMKTASNDICLSYLQVVITRVFVGVEQVA